MMKGLLGTSVVVAAIVGAPVAAAAQERAGDAALGAISGAIVGGPIGLVAGGVIGYTAGPNIARGWFGTHHHVAHRVSSHRHAARNDVTTGSTATPAASPAGAEAH